MGFVGGHFVGSVGAFGQKCDLLNLFPTVIERFGLSSLDFIGDKLLRGQFWVTWGSLGVLSSVLLALLGKNVIF